MNCINCRHWNLRDSPLRQHGMGLCKVNPDPVKQPGQTFGPSLPCKFDRFIQAPLEVVARRTKEIGGKTP